MRQLFDNSWLHLFALKDGAVTARYRRGLEWETGQTAIGIAA